MWGFCRFVLLGIFLCSSNVWAQAVEAPPDQLLNPSSPQTVAPSQPASQPSEETYDNYRSKVANPPNGFWLYPGIKIGYGALSTEVANERDKDGFHLAFSMLGTFFWESWVLDVGFAYYYSKLSSAEAPGLDTGITTRAFLGEISPRLRLGQNWQLGVATDLYFGVDYSFSESVGDPSIAFFVGPQVNYDFAFTRMIRGRFGIQLTTDLNISDRQVYLALASLEVGFPLIGYNPPPENKGKTKIIFKYIREPYKEPPDVARITLSGKYFPFADNSAILSSRSADYLGKVAEVLKKYNDIWQEVEIRGHTSSTGTKQHNIELSWARAGAVATRIHESGIDKDRLVIYGYGPDMPIAPNSTREGQAQNRRVELLFLGVKENAELMQELRAIPK